MFYKIIITWAPTRVYFTKTDVYFYQRIMLYLKTRVFLIVNRFSIVLWKFLQYLYFIIFISIKFKRLEFDNAIVNFFLLSNKCLIIYVIIFPYSMEMRRGISSVIHKSNFIHIFLLFSFPLNHWRNNLERTEPLRYE